MTPFGNVPVNSVLPIFFNTFNAAGASVTITGLAITDIEVYKGTSMTQRSSDNGYVLLDTDGIDLDGITGIQGFSIDLSDNSDAGFYAAGSFYNVVISAITVDGQTVNFHAATFRIVAAEQTAGTPSVNVTTWNNLATVALPLVPTTAGRTLDVSAGGEAGVDWANVGSPTTTLNLSGTTISTTQKVDVETIKTNPVVNGGTVTFPTNATLASTTNITAGTMTTTTNLTNLPAITANWLTATGIAADAITAAKLAADVGAEIADAVWDEAIAGHLGAGSTGAALNAAGAAGDPWITSLPGAYSAGQAGFIIGTFIDAAITSRLAATDVPANFTDLSIAITSGFVTQSQNSADKAWLTAARTLTAGTNIVLPSNGLSNVSAWTVAITGSLSGSVGSVSGNIGGNLGGTLTTTERNAIADAMLNRDMAAVTVTNSRSPINGFRALRNRWSNAGGTYSVYAEDDTAVAWSGPVATDAAAIPVVGVDPT